MTEYLQGGMTVAAKKFTKVYVDLFAGPGINVDENTREEYEGAALRAVQLRGDGPRARFTSAYLVNIDPEQHEALRTRVDKLDAEGRLAIPRCDIFHVLGDANEHVGKIMTVIDTRAWVFAYVDIENHGQLPFSTVRALKELGHSSVDLYALFPNGISLQRQMSFQKEDLLRYGAGLTEFFGSEQWRDLHAERTTPAHTAEFHMAIERLYCERLRTLWSHAGAVTRIRFGNGLRLYEMLFAGSNTAAVRLANGVTQRVARNQTQGTLFD